MRITSLADAQLRLPELVQAVEGTWERILITRNGEPAAVLISTEDLQTMIETLEVLRELGGRDAIDRAAAGPLVTGEEMAVIMARRRADRGS